jgi:hypothetical protein
MLGFSEAEFDDMALCEGKSKKVSTAAGAYAVNTVLSMEYCGDTALLEKNSLTADDTVNLKKGFTAACF